MSTIQEPETTPQDFVDEELTEQPAGETTLSSDKEIEADNENRRRKARTLSPLSKFTRNEDTEQRPNLSLREIFGGDFLTAKWLRHQIGFILVGMFFIIIYITNRYSAEQELIEIQNLKVELQEIKYYALTRSGELTTKTRQSNIEEQLMHNGDSTLRMPKEPPFIIKIKSKE